jgi:hypothetical protein
MSDLIQSVRSDEASIANGPILGKEINGDYIFQYDSEWAKNAEKAAAGGQQRAYFKNEELGKKLLSTSQFYKLAVSSTALKPHVIGRKSNKNVIKIKKDTEFTCTITEGRITAITVKGAAST